MSANFTERDQAFMSEEAYLSEELVRETRHEYIDGQIYAMEGASRNDERIAGNLTRELGSRLKPLPREPFSSNIKVNFYPDVMVVYDEEPTHAHYYTESPMLIVDVQACRKSEGWVSRHYFLGDEVTFESSGLTLPGEEIYARVANEGVRAYLEKKQPAITPGS